MTRRAGYIAVVGRPNVGKSTLMNQIVGEKISIISRKPQTTRHRIHGIYTTENTQFVFVDTPGIHWQEVRHLNKQMNRAAINTMMDVDVVVWVVDAQRWTDDDERVLSCLKPVSCPVILFINKVDRIKDKAQLLPMIDALSKRYDFEAVVLGSALKNKYLDELLHEIEQRLPESEFIFPEDYLTDRSLRFLVAEIIREKLMHFLGDEMPYSTTVEIERFDESSPDRTEIHALILVERKGQKKAVIGEQGQRIKKIGMAARKDIERLLDSHVRLELWVKVKEGWADDERAIRSLGIDSER